MAEPSRNRQLHPKHARTDHEILDEIRRRWSPRAYDPARDVSSDDLRRLFEAARWAPSSFNEQPWRFLVTSRERSPASFDKLLSALTPKNQAWAAAAPLLVLVTLRRTKARDESVNPLAWYDTGQAVAFLTLQATAMGLSVRQMEGFDREVARTNCEIPAPFEPAVVMAIGYAGDPETLTIDQHRDAELQPRNRRVVSEFVYEGEWGRPLET